MGPKLTGFMVQLDRSDDGSALEIEERRPQELPKHQFCYMGMNSRMVFNDKAVKCKSNDIHLQRD
jgi:hypothetical protein